MFDTINHEYDKAEQKKKQKNRAKFGNEEKESDCILHGYVKKLVGHDCTVEPPPPPHPPADIDAQPHDFSNWNIPLLKYHFWAPSPTSELSEFLPTFTTKSPKK